MKKSPHDTHHMGAAEEAQSESTAPDITADTVAEPSPAEQSKHHVRIWRRIRSIPKKWLALGSIGTLVGITAVLLLTPLGYPVIGRFFTQDVSISATDTTFRLAVADVSIVLDGNKQDFSGKGPFVLQKVKAGKHTAVVSKPYYKDQVVTFTIKPLSKRGQTMALTADLSPTGRPVLVTITDSLSGSALQDATISFESTESKSNDKGEATVVLPSSANDGTITIKKDGYNTLDTTITVDGDTTNKVKLTPSGRVYFFSKRSGNIDLYSSNLDGSDQKVALAATGNETDDTSLFVSPDRRWLAFLSSRDGIRSQGVLLNKLYVYDTTNGRLIAADEGDAYFRVTGWSRKNTLVYTVDTYTDQTYTKESRYKDRYKVKIYNPNNNEIKLVYSNTVNLPEYKDEYLYAWPRPRAFYGDNDTLGATILLDDYIAFVINKDTFNPSYDYYSYGSLYPSKSSLAIANLDGKIERYLDKDVGYLYPQRYSFNTLSYTINNVYYEYDASNNKEAKEQPPANPEPIPTRSASGQKTAWSDNRDGQSVTFVGDRDGNNEQQIVAKTGMVFLEWYSEDYLLMLNTENEYALYIIAAKPGSQPIKISNIHSYSANYYRGY